MTKKLPPSWPPPDGGRNEQWGGVPSPSGRGQGWGAVAVLFFLIGMHIFLALPAITELSPTYDEPVHLTAGAVYWKTGDYRYNGYHHPPFGEMWAAIPLLFMNPLVPKQHPAWIAQRWTPHDQYGFADTFLYKNRVDAARMMSAGRAMQLALSCLLGAAVFFTAYSLAGLPARQNAGGQAGFLATAFWAFSPTFLANGTIVSTDLAFTVFFFGFFACLMRMGDWRFDAGAGVCFGLAFASKYFALSLLPIFAVLLLIVPSLRKPRSWCIAVATAFVALLLVYRFTNLDVFWGGLTEIFSRSQAGRSSFFNGQHGTQGWLFYFPYVFMVKTPIPLLLALGGTMVAVGLKKCRIPALLWVPPVLFFLVACTSKVQIGHRHIMAIYPFLFVIAALGITSSRHAVWPGTLASENGGPGHKIAGATSVILILWLAMQTWLMRPHYLAYFNEIVGGPANGYKHLTDSNVDWGQGLKQLGESLSEQDKADGIYLTYFGVADPHYYGIRYLDIGSDRIVQRQDDTALNLAPTKLAISVTNLQGTYYADHAVFNWVKSYEPAKIIGHSIFLYDFSGKPEALAMLKGMRQ